MRKKNLNSCFSKPIENWKSKNIISKPNQSYKSKSIFQNQIENVYFTAHVRSSQKMRTQWVKESCDDWYCFNLSASLNHGQE